MFEGIKLGPFPLGRLKRVDKPTTLITDNVQRIDFRESAIARARRGDYGTAVQRESNRYASKYPLCASLIDSVTHLSALNTNKVAASKAPIPEDPELLSLHIKRLGYFLKADIVGICRLPKSAVYSHDMYGKKIDMDYEFAIVFVMRKEYRTVKASTGTDWMGGAISFQVYQHLSLITETIANYIRRLGYPASAQHPPSGTDGGFQVLMPPLLIWAGIGEVSRAGIILNPFLGMNFKAAAVLTDLPLVPDKPIDFGLQDFCQQCNICALACPSKAISTGDKTMYNGYETWKLDEKNCATFNRLNKRGTVCNTCIRVCPWTRPLAWNHNLVRLLVGRFGTARRVAIMADNILGRGKIHKKNSKEKWWFDLEELNGKLRIPTDEGDWG